MEQLAEPASARGRGADADLAVAHRERRAPRPEDHVPEDRRRAVVRLRDLGLLVVVMESRRSAQLRAPIIDFAHGELEKTRDKYRPHLMRVPGSPILVFTADQYRACEEGQSHTLAWLRGTDQGIAVFSGRAPHLGESNR